MAFKGLSNFAETLISYQLNYVIFKRGSEVFEEFNNISYFMLFQ